MCTCTGRRAVSALATKAPGNATQPISSAIAITFASMAPASPKVANLVSPMPMETTASVATTAAPSSPAAIRSDSRMMPAPTVPPASGPQPKDATAKPRFESDKSAPPHQPAQRDARHQHSADHHRSALAGEHGVAPGTERAGRHRCDQHDQRPPPVDERPERRHATGIGEQRRQREDRHDRLGAHDRHQHQRHQRAGAVAGNPADHRSDQRHPGDQDEFRQGDVGEARDQRFEHHGDLISAARVPARLRQDQARSPHWQQVEPWPLQRS